MHRLFGVVGGARVSYGSGLRLAWQRVECEELRVRLSEVLLESSAHERMLSEVRMSQQTAAASSARESQELRSRLQVNVFLLGLIFD